ncbi:MAG TPA: hypothetical protein VGS02_16005 [Acidobacteriaceae bacterium]|nr:hypothetical protein [Acidobacteriaceae bacterium]
MMQDSSSNSVHLIVQHTQTEKQSCFRIVAYCGDARFQPAEFVSSDELLKALQSALGAFDERWLVLREDEYRGTYIAFMGDFELSQNQLVQMGLRRL